MTMPGWKENSHNFFSSIKGTFILAFIMINLHNTLRNISPPPHANTDGKGSLIASKLIKKFWETCLFVKSYFGFYVLFILWF
jgi:hypothetical protein